MRVHNLKATGVQIAVRDSSLFTKQYQGKLSYSSQNPNEIAQKARELFQTNHNWRSSFVRAVTVRAIDLVPKNQPEQVSLFVDVEQIERNEKLFIAIEEIRRRYGKHAVYQAVLMGDIKMPEYRDHNLVMPGAMNR